MNPIPKIVIYKNENTSIFTFNKKSISLVELLDEIEKRENKLYRIETWEDEHLLLRCIVIYSNREYFENRLKRFAKAQV